MILITGASGLVGESIYKLFRKHYKVVGTAYPKSYNQLIRLDLTNPKLVNAFFKKYKVNTIIHCAAAMPSKTRKTSLLKIYKDNMLMLSNILKNLSDKIMFINISGTSLYHLKGTGSLNEKSPKEGRTLYLLSKLRGEELLKSFYAGSSNLLNMRISSPYSVERESDTIIYTLIKSALKNRSITLWGTGARRQAFTNIDSLANTIKILYEKQISGDYNFVTTDSISMLELARIIKKQFGVYQVSINKISKKDPEEFFRKRIDISKIRRLVKTKDTLDSDISKIVKRLS